MSKKHVYDSSDGLVLKSLRGAVRINPGIRLHEPSKTVYIAQSPRLHPPAPDAPTRTTLKNFNKHTSSSRARVAVISGGGSGHEPAHAGYVGAGMLSAAVAGDIFASPSAKQILKAIELAAFSSLPTSNLSSQQTETVKEIPKDVLAIINNYTGDILNFGLAIEKARIQFPQMSITSVVVADDISLLQHNHNPLVGARGLGANILTCKVLGALAAQDSDKVDLGLVKAYGDALVGNIVSLGVGLEHCHVPGRSKEDNKEDKMGEDECEIGLGLHNEPGVIRANLTEGNGGGGKEGGTTRRSSLVDRMLVMLLDSKERLRVDCQSEDGVVLFINNLGGMSQLEMGAVVEDSVTHLEEERIKIRRIYCSSYMTSLNAPGFSISLINVHGLHRALQTANYNDINISLGSVNADPSPSNSSASGSKSQENTSDGSESQALRERLLNIDLESLLDASTDALAWVGARTMSFWDSRAEGGPENIYADVILEPNRPSQEDDDNNTSTQRNISSETIKECIRQACLRVLDIEKELTEFDAIVGDGDCGETFAAGANAILSRLEKKTLIIDNRSYSSIIRDLADIIEDNMGGTIGALFAIFLNNLSSSLAVQNSTVNINADSSWRESLTTALHTLSTYTPAKIGDRTIIDALAPFCEVLRAGKSFAEGVQHAMEGAESTRGMRPNLGRATYSTRPTDDSVPKLQLPPDPGAWGVSAILQGLSAGLEEY